MKLIFFGSITDDIVLCFTLIDFLTGELTEAKNTEGNRGLFGVRVICDK
jgi:hypothetical protein